MLSIFAHSRWSKIIHLKSELPLRFIWNMTLEQTCHLAGLTMILCCMCFLDSWFACIFFIIYLFYGFVSWHTSFVCWFLFFIPILFCSFVPRLWLDALPVCICAVTSCPVLEFELRKAKETIQALRTNLTQAAGVASSLLFLHLKPFVFVTAFSLFLFFFFWFPLYKSC